MRFAHIFVKNGNSVFFWRLNAAIGALVALDLGDGRGGWLCVRKGDVFGVGVVRSLRSYFFVFLTAAVGVLVVLDLDRELEHQILALGRGGLLQRGGDRVESGSEKRGGGRWSGKKNIYIFTYICEDLHI